MKLTLLRRTCRRSDLHCHQMSFLLPAVRKAFGVGASAEASLGSSTFAGMLIGCYCWGTMCDRKGRRPTYASVAAFTAVAALVSASMRTFEGLVMSRFFVGIGVGGAPAAFSLFSEFIPCKGRGRTLVLLEGAFWSLGSVAEALLASVVLGNTDEPGNEENWRWLLVWSAAPVMLVCVILTVEMAFPQLGLLPESAHWSHVNGRIDEAEAILRKAAAENGRPFARGNNEARTDVTDAQSCSSAAHGSDTTEDTTPSAIVADTPTAAADTEAKPSSAIGTAGGAHGPTPCPPLLLKLSGGDQVDVLHERGTVRQLFMPMLRLTTCLLWLIWSASVMVYYGFVLVTPSYFEAQKQSKYVSALIGAVAELPGLLTAVFLIDRVGRRVTMVVLFTTQCAASATLAMFAGGTDVSVGVDNVRALTVAAIVGRAAINGAFAAVFVYTPEVYPTTVRGLGLGAASACGRVAGIVTPFITSVLGDVKQGDVRAPLVIFSIASAIAAACAAALPFETNGAVLCSSSSHYKEVRLPKRDPLRKRSHSLPDGALQQILGTGRSSAARSAGSDEEKRGLLVRHQTVQ